MSKQIDPPVHEHTGQCVIALPPDEALPHARRYVGSEQASTTWLDEARVFMDRHEAGAHLATLRGRAPSIFGDARVAFLLLEVQP